MKHFNTVNDQDMRWLQRVILKTAITDKMSNESALGNFFYYLPSLIDNICLKI